jgi:hypothetical protein
MRRKSSEKRRSGSPMVRIIPGPQILNASDPIEDDYLAAEGWRQGHSP